MWITQVELHNIKSYGKHTTIDLAQGVNAICGKNGAGKSTILEAIGLALFGKSAYKNQEQFIHEKAKKGEITITLFDSRDERLYQIVRPIKGGSAPYVYDPETRRQLATGVDDVQRWLRDCMRVEPTTDLKALFENAIGVAQGLLTVSFLETEANRRKVFDPLLNVEDYKQAYDKLRAVNSQVKEWQSENTAQQARLEGQLEALPGHRAEAQDLADKIQTAEGQLNEIRVKLGHLDKVLADLEAQKELVSRLTQQLEKLADRLTAGQDQLQTAQAELEQARQSQAEVKHCEADYRTYEQAQKEWFGLENNRNTRDEISHRLVTVRHEIALLEQNSNNLQKQLQDVAKAEAKLVELEPQVKEQQSLEEALQHAKRAMEQLETARQRFTDEQRRQQSLEQDLTQVQAQVQQRQTLTQEIEQIEQQRDQQLEELNMLGDKLTGLEQQIETLRQALQAAQNQVTTYQNLQDRIRHTNKTITQRQETLDLKQAEIVQRRELESQREILAGHRKQQQAELLSLEVQISDREAAERQTQQSLNDWRSKAEMLKNYQGNLATVTDKLARTQTELATLEEEISHRQKLLAEITALEAEGVDANLRRDTIKDSASHYGAKLSQIGEAVTALAVEADSPCPVCRKPLSEHDIGSLKEHYQGEGEQLTTQLAETEANLQEIEAQLKRVQRQTKKLQIDLEKLPNQAQVEKQQELVAGYQNETAGLQAEITLLEEAPAQVDQLQREVDQIGAALSKLKQDRANVSQADRADEQQQQQLQSQISQLARPADVEQRETELLALQADLEQISLEAERLANTPQQLADLQAQEQVLSGQKKQLQEYAQEVSRKREQLAQQVQQYQTQMNSLATPGRIDQLQTDIEAQKGIVAEWQDKVAELDSAPEQLKSVEAALNQLGDPRRDYLAAQSEAAKRPGLEAELNQIRSRLEEAQRTRVGVEQELLPFTNLDIELEQVNDTLNRTRNAHRTYLEHRATAELLPQREARAAEVQQLVADLEQQKKTISQELAKAQAGYDPAGHQRKGEERAEAGVKQTQLETQLAGYRQQLPQAQTKVKDLEAVAVELAGLKQEGERLVRLQEVVDFIRRTIRDAGPEITRRLVKAVSLRADQIFADIVDDHQQELIWDETYSITIRRDGYMRDFQQLSGGEAMAAALAVRLALLQSMSAVDVAFFDEPTAHLDPERRANLSEQIARIKGFSQLVVISHDDTFEQDTGHVIHIAKDEQGYSQVV